MGEIVGGFDCLLPLYASQKDYRKNERLLTYFFGRGAPSLKAIKLIIYCN